MAKRKRAGSQQGPAWGKIIAAVLVCAALAAVWRWTPLSEYVTAERVSGWARATREHRWAPLFVVLIYTPAAFVLFPRPLLTLLTAVAFGPWLGFVYSMLGIMTSALATYYTGRVMPEKTVKSLAGDKLQQMSKRLKKHGFIAVFAIRMIPAAPFAVESMVAGAARFKVTDFMLGTFLGMAPGVLLTTVFGNELSAALDDAAEINYWIIGAAVVAFAIFSFFIGRWLKKQAG